MMENEIRPIDANALIRNGWVLEKHGVSNCIIGRMSLADVPTIDLESLRPKGRWIVKQRHTVSSNPYMDDNYHTHVTCPECNVCIQSENASFDYPEPRTTNYCPTAARRWRLNNGIRCV